jgi:hypothetical protein
MNLGFINMNWLLLYMKIGVSTAVMICVTLFWAMTAVGGYKRFGGTY